MIASRRLYVAAIGAAVVWWCATSIHAQPDDCQLPTGLYAQRVALEKQIDNMYRDNPYSDRSKLEREESALDVNYVRFMNAVVERIGRNDTDSIEACCRDQRDPVAKLSCALVQYRLNPEQGWRAFIASLPRGKQERLLVWKLDSIAATATHELPDWPAFPLPNGLSLAYVDELFRLVEADRSGALEAYLGLLASADGSYAGFMSDQVASLFEARPSLVLARWSTFRRYKYWLGGETVPPDQAERISSQFADMCRPPDRRCCERRVLRAPTTARYSRSCDPVCPGL